MDRLTKLLSHFSLHAGVFYTGNICGIHDFAQDRLRGHIHLVRRGPVKILGVDLAVLDIQEPTLLFMSRPDTHQLVADERTGAALIATGGRFLARGEPSMTYELGLKQRTVLLEFDSVEQAVAAHDCPAYQAALAALGDGADRDIRIIEAV